MCISGQYDYDFRIVYTTREGSVCVLRRGWVEGKPIFRMTKPAIGLTLLPTEKTNVVVCADRSLDCYSMKGKRLWGVSLQETVVCMVSILLAHVGQTLICVALRGGLIQIYLNKVIVDHFNVVETVTAMTFGRLGQEDHVLVLVTAGERRFISNHSSMLSFPLNLICYVFAEGSLAIKILKRTAEFVVETVDFQDRTHERSGALQIPKKTKVFVEQTIRERENAPGISEHITEKNLSFVYSKGLFARTNREIKREINFGLNFFSKILEIN